MKRVATGFLLSVVTVFGLTGCFENNKLPMVSVSKEIVRVNSDAQTVSVTVMSNTDWTAQSNVDWIKISKASGRGTANVELVISSYELTAEREGSVTVSTSSGEKATVRVLQSAANGILMVSPQEMTVGANASTVSFAIASNSEWTLFSSTNWAVPSVTSGSGNAVVKVNVAANPSQSEEREAVISVIVKEETGESIVSTMTIKQITCDLPSITLAQDAIYFAHDAMSAGTGTVTIPVITNVTGTLSATCDFNWCNAVYYNGKITITVENNTANASRQALVTLMGNVNGEAVSSQITVYQAGLGTPEVVFSNDVIVLEARDNTASNKQSVITAYSATPQGVGCRVVEDYPEWISCVSLMNNVLSFDVENNTLPEERQATITVVAQLGSQTALFPVSVIQLGEDNLNVSLSQEYVNFTSRESEISIGAFSTVRNIKLYATVSNADWCTVDVTDMSTAMTYSSAITIKAEANPSASPRTANVIVTAGSDDQRVVKSIPVSQAGIGGPDIQVLEENIVIPNEGAVEADNVAVNFIGLDAFTTLNIVSSESWIKGVVSSDKTRILMVANANPHTSDRTATVTVIAKKGDQTQIIPITATQLGKGAAELEFERTSYSYAKDAASYVAYVKCLNGTTYSVISNPVWMTVEASMNQNPTVLKFNLTKNEDADARSGKIVILASNGDDLRYYTIVISQDGLNSPSVYPVAKSIVVPHIMRVTSHLDYTVRIIGAEDEDTSIEVTTADSWISKVYVDMYKRYIGFWCEYNNNVEDRQGTITIIAKRGGEIMTTDFTVTQLGTGSAGLEFAAQSYTVSSQAQKFNIPVGRINNSTYKIASLPNWITINNDRSTPNNLWINISANKGADDRSGEIVFLINNSETGRGNEDLYQSIAITQAGVGGPNVIPVTTEIVFAQSGKQYINVKCENSADIFAKGDVKFSCSETWIKTPVVVAPSSLVFAVTSENNDVFSRTGTVSAIFTKGGEEQLINFTVTQLGTGSAGLQFVTTNYEVTSPRQQLIVPLVKLNKSAYNVVEYPSFIERIMEKDGAIYVTFSENKDAEDRSGEIVFRVTNSSSLIADETIYQSVTVTQAGIGGPNVIPLANVLTFGRKSEEQNIVRSLNFDPKTSAVSFTSSESWVEGSMDAEHNTFVFTTTADNTYVEARTAIVTVVVEKGGKTQILNFTIIQRGTGSAGLDFYKDSYDVASTGGSLAIPLITLNTSVYEVVQTPSWMTVTSRDADCATFEVSANTNANDRGGEVIFKVSNSENPDEIIYQSVQINQAGIGGPNIIPVTTVLSFNKEAGQTKFIKLVNSDGVSFKNFSCSEKWVEAEIVNDAITNTPKIAITMKKSNEGVAARTANISVIAQKGGKEQILNFSVTQAGTGSAMLTFAQEVYEIPAAETSFDIQVISENSTVFKVIQYPKWFESISNTTEEAHSATGTISVSVKKNDASETRSGEIIILVKNSANPDEVIYQTIQVIQAGIGGPNLIATKSEIVLEKEQKSKQVVSLINADKVSITDYSATEDWVKVKGLELKKYSDNVIDFKIVAAQDNDLVDSRSAVVTIVAEKGGFTQILNFNVKQLGTGSGSVSFVSDTYSVPASGHSSDALHIPVIMSNDAYIEVQNEPEWIDATVVTTPDAGIDVLVADNPFAEIRTGEIILKVQNSGKSETIYQSITIIQSGIGGPAVSYAPSNIVFSNEGSEKPFVALTNYSGVKFTAISSDEWLVAPVFKEEKGRLKFEEAPGKNESADARTAVITVVAEKGGQSQIIKIPVTQLAVGDAGLEFSTNDYNVVSQESSLKIPVIKINGSTYEIVSAPDWTDPDESTFDTDLLVLDIEANEQADDRTGEVVFRVSNGGNDIFQTISVTQAGVGGPNVIPATDVITIKAKAGEVNIPYINGDGVTFSFYPDKNWIEASESDGMIKFESIKNSGAEARNCTVTVVASKGGKSQILSFSITQVGTGSPEVVFANDRYEVSQWTKVIPVPYTANTSIEVVYKDDLIEGVDVTTTEGVAVIVLSSNTSTKAQSGSVVFAATRGNETVYYTINITRSGAEGPAVSLASTSSVFEADSTGTRSIILGNYLGSTIKAYSSESWLTVGAFEKGKIPFTVATSNPGSESRVADITVVAKKNGESQMLNFTVTQLGAGSPSVQFSTDRIVSDANGGTYALVNDVSGSTTLKAMTKNTYSGSGEWFTRENVNVNKDNINVTENESTAMRWGELVYCAKAGNESVLYSIPVIQFGAEGPSVTLPIGQLSVSPYGSENNKVFYTDLKGDLECRVDSDWISVTSDEDGEVVFDTETNNTGSARYGHIVLTVTKGDDSISKSILVSQAAAGDPELVIVAPKDAKGQYHFTVGSEATTLLAPLYGSNMDITSSEYPFSVVSIYPISAFSAEIVDSSLKIVLPENESGKRLERVVFVGVKKTGATGSYGDYYQVIPVYISQLSVSGSDSSFETLSVTPRLINVDKTVAETSVNLELASSIAGVTATVYASKGIYTSPQTGEYDGITLKSWILFSYDSELHYNIEADVLDAGNNEISLVIYGMDEKCTGYIVFDNGKGKTVTVTVNQN